MSILEELYNGTIHPSERYIREGGEYQKLTHQLAESITGLMSGLPTEKKQLYEKIENTLADLSYISEKECFTEGFRIGARIMLETLGFESVPDHRRI